MRITDKWTREFLRSLEWKKFEEICVEYLKVKNCNADVTSIGSDGGIDIKISHKGKVFAIGQCKSWSKPIGVNLIRELYGVMAADSIKHGIFLTTSKYSKDALSFGKDKNLILIDSEEFIKLINKLPQESRKKIFNVATEGEYTTPSCVKCDVKMIRRTVKNGDRKGNEFWGCANFPKCRNIMHMKKVKSQEKRT